MKFVKKLIKFILQLIKKTSIPFYIFSYFKDCYYDYRYQKIRKNYNISDDFKFNGIDIEFYGEGIIEIGKKSYIGNRSVLQVCSNCKIQIGNNCAISHNVRIYTSNRFSEDIISNKKNIRYKKGDVIIGNNCWIGANVFITEGTKIGNNVVIGANSIVTKDIESNTLVGGVPAKIIRHRRIFE